MSTTEVRSLIQEKNPGIDEIVYYRRTEEEIPLVEGG